MHATLIQHSNKKANDRAVKIYDDIMAILDPLSVDFECLQHLRLTVDALNKMINITNNGNYVNIPFNHFRAVEESERTIKFFTKLMAITIFKRGHLMHVTVF